MGLTMVVLVLKWDVSVGPTSAVDTMDHSVEMLMLVLEVRPDIVQNILGSMALLGKVTKSARYGWKL